MLKIDPATETVDTCALCQSRDWYTDPRFATSLGLVDPYGVACCKHCGLRWLSPRPSPKGYRDLYTAENYFDGENAVENYSAIAPVRARYFRERIVRLERHFDKQMLSILDVGAATGEFLNEARARGHLPTGLEPSAAARQTAKEKYGITLLDVDIAALGGSARFDIVHMNHVFEHLPDPVAALKTIRRLLKDNGILAIEVPQQIHNDLDRLKQWLGIAKPPCFNAYSLHHTYFYTPTTLRRLLMQSGFIVKHLRTANPARTPLRPLNVRNLALRAYLWLSDALHKGGNIIETHAQKSQNDLE